MNDYLALKELLPFLIKSSEPNTLQIIVCDGGSCDLTLPYIRKLQKQSKTLCDIQYIQTAKGRAVQMNTGASLALHQGLLFLHADTVLPLKWYESLNTQTWSRFKVRLSGNAWVFRVIESMMNWRSCITNVATGDQALFVNKVLFKQVGGYPQVPLMEDIALSKKLKLMSPVKCLNQSVTTSSRRWENNGIAKTVLLMWSLRFLYFIGVSPEKLAPIYYPKLAFQKTQRTIQLFAKIPQQGFVKTRLIDAIGAKSATDIHRYLLNNNLTVIESINSNCQLWYAKPFNLSKQEAIKLIPKINFESIEQKGDNLGSRMSYAIKQGLEQSHQVILMGSDTLDISNNHLNDLFNGLEQKDVMILPAQDGGFLAMACNLFDEAIFKDIEWGKSTVLKSLLSNLNSLTIEYDLLPPVRDIDTIDDVKDYAELKPLYSKL